jgi:ankyrin repeat protein
MNPVFSLPTWESYVESHPANSIYGIYEQRSNYFFGHAYNKIGLLTDLAGDCCLAITVLSVILQKYSPAYILPISFIASKTFKATAKFCFNKSNLVINQTNGTELITSNLDEYLILAAKNGDTKFLQHLICQGANPNYQDIDGSCPLHYAAQRGHDKTVELLLKLGARVNQLSRKNGTALLFACGYGDITYYKRNPKVVEFLLRNGANPRIVDSNLKSPLDYAKQEGCEEIVNLLRRYGA